MRKLIISALMAATILPAGTAFAQSPREIRKDQRDIRQEQRELRQAQRYGTRADVREQRRDVREARRELREDWRDYRRDHRAVYTLPRYYAPRGHVYRPVRVGIALNPAFYGQRYWIADPYRYRLPRPGYNQRWIRYGNDVLLINARSGRVIQVINGFFY
jgi:Ni/Co efflux regulator RcnB